MRRTEVIFALLLAILLPGVDAVAGGEEFSINTHVDNNQHSSWASAHKVASLQDGRFVAVWQSFEQDGSHWGVYAQVFEQDGTKVNGQDILVASDTSLNQEMANVAALDDGGFVVVWGSMHSGDWDVWARTFDRDGQNPGTDILVNSHTAEDQYRPDIAKTEGGFVVTWRSNHQGNYDIFARRYDDSFEALDVAEFLVNTNDNTDEAHPQVGALSDGGFAIAWRTQTSENSYDVALQVFNSEGQKIGIEMIANSHLPGEQRVLGGVAGLEGGGFAMTWASHNQPDGTNWDVFVRIFDVSRSQVTANPEIKVNADATSGDQYGSAVLAVGTGFLVAFNDHAAADLFAQLFDASGVAVGSRFRVNPTTGNPQINPGMARLAGTDRVVIVWSSDGQDGSSWGMFGVFGCIPGYTEEEGASPGCLPCASNSYKEEWGMQECQQCTAGSVAPAGSASSSGCVNPGTLDSITDQGEGGLYLRIDGVRSAGTGFGNDAEWEIEIVYTSASTVLYLPGGTLPAASAFPCSLSSYNADTPSQAETACCLLAFRDNYTPTKLFHDWATENEAAITPGGDCATSSAVAAASPASSTHSELFGSTSISFETVDSALEDPPGTARAIIKVPGNELAQVSTSVATDTGTEHNLFVGLAKFESAAGRILTSSSHQLSVVLMEATSFVVTSHGSTDYSLLQWVLASSVQVLDQGDASAAPANYATVTFQVKDGLSVPDGGQLVPLSSVRAGGVQVCQPYSGSHNALVTQPCGPNVIMCEAQTSVNSDNVGTIHIPISLGAPADSVSIELAIAMEDGSGRPVMNMLTIDLATTDANTAQWCTLDQLLFGSVNVKLYVGSTDDASALAALPQLDLNTDQSLVQDSFAAPSVESGLLTLVAESSNADVTLTVEHVTTLHINGDALADEVLATLADHPFISGASTLSASPEIQALCPEVPISFLTSCALRNDVVGGTPVAANAYSVGGGAADTFMQALTGSDGAWAAALGNSFEAAITANHGGGTAVWVNPGFAWAGDEGVSALSSEVILTARIALQAGGERRRALLQTPLRRAADKTFPGAAVHFQVSPAALAAAVLSVPEQHVTSWGLSLESSPNEVCLPTTELVGALRERLLRLVAPVSSGVVDVQILSFALNRAGVDCSRLRRSSRRLSSSSESPSVSVEALIVVAEPSGEYEQPHIDAQRLTQTPGVLSAVQLQPSSVAMTTPDDASRPAYSSADTSSSSPLIIVVVVLSALLVVGALAFVWRRKRWSSSDDAAAAAAAFTASRKNLIVEAKDKDVVATMIFDSQHVSHDEKDFAKREASQASV